MSATKKYHFWVFQIVLHLVVFGFYVADRDPEIIESYRYAYFANYALAAALINFIALPLFYRNKRVISFILLFCLFILVSVLIEEMVLEHIFFKRERSHSFEAIRAFVTIVPVVAILTGFKFGWDAFIKQAELERLERAIRESEMQFLKSQINPHFLFNNLNNLYAYALEQSPKTPDIILQLSNLLRYMLYECKEQYVPLSKEIDQLKNFVHLSQLQIDYRGEVNLTISPPNGSYAIAPLILMVFVENAFKHGQSSQSEEIYISIELNCSEDGHLFFRCINNYEENGNTDNLDSGIGLNNVKKRLELLYPKAHELKIDLYENYYKVELSIHLSKNHSL